MLPLDLAVSPSSIWPWSTMVARLLEKRRSVRRADLKRPWQSVGTRPALLYFPLLCCFSLIKVPTWNLPLFDAGAMDPKIIKLHCILCFNFLWIWPSEGLIWCGHLGVDTVLLIRFSKFCWQATPPVETSNLPYGRPSSWSSVATGVWQSLLVRFWHLNQALQELVADACAPSRIWAPASIFLRLRGERLRRQCSELISLFGNGVTTSDISGAGDSLNFAFGISVVLTRCPLRVASLRGCATRGVLGSLVIFLYFLVQDAGAFVPCLN